MKTQMNYSYQHQASNVGLMPSYWSMIEICDNRTLEIQGSQETVV